MAKLSTYSLILRSGLTANAGSNTLVVPYKPGDAQTDFAGGAAMLLVNGGRLVLREDTDTFTIAYNVGDFTITWHDLLHTVGDTDDVSITHDLFLSLFLPATGAVDVTRQINTTAPLQGGGDLSADRTLSIAANGITDALFRQGSAVSVVGRAANSIGNTADIVAGGNDLVLARVGNALSFVNVSIAMGGTGAVTADGAVGNLINGATGEANLAANDKFGFYDLTAVTGRSCTVQQIWNSINVLTAYTALNVNDELAIRDGSGGGNGVRKMTVSNFMQTVTGLDTNILANQVFG